MNTPFANRLNTERLHRLGILEAPMGYVDGANLYEYVGSNPEEYTDPTGLIKTEFKLKNATHTPVKGVQGDWIIHQQYEKNKVTTVIEYGGKGGCDCDEIGFIQISRVTDMNGQPIDWNPMGSNDTRTTPTMWAVDKGYDDKLQPLKNPFFGLDNNGNIGERFLDTNFGTANQGKSRYEYARMGDKPDVNMQYKNHRYVFEIYAICRKGKEAGKILDGLSWGFDSADDGPTGVGIVKGVHQPANIDTPSWDFAESLGIWNGIPGNTVFKPTNLPTTRPTSRPATTSTSK